MVRAPRRSFFAAAMVVLLVAAAPRSAAAFDVSFSGKVWSDLRFATDCDPSFPTNAEERGVLDLWTAERTDRELSRWSCPGEARDFTFIRNENTLLLRLDIEPEDRIRGVAEVELSFFGFSRASSLEELTFREAIDPFRVEMNALYVSIYDFLGVDALDLRIGRQILVWGTADKFNPTDWINSDDLEDPLLFGQNIANQMLRVDYGWDDFTLTAVVIPIFRPAQLPKSALIALTDPSLTPVTSIREGLGPLIDLLESLIGRDGEFGTLTVLPKPVLPKVSLQNMQYAAKLGWRILDIDLSLSFYHGFEDLPLPKRSRTFIGGEANALEIISEVELTYVRFTSVGIDLAANVSFLDDAGIWAEAAVFIPERLDLEIEEITSSILPDIPSPRPRINVVRGVPFFKATVGADYTPRPWLYVNLQYVYGFIDEFGAGNLKHYVVAGADVRFAKAEYVLRLFAAWSLEESAVVVFPALLVYAFEGLELSVGAFLNFGPEKPVPSKFGSPAAGRSNVFLRATATF